MAHDLDYSNGYLGLDYSDNYLIDGCTGYIYILVWLG